MDKTRGSGRRMLSGVLVLLLIVSMVPFLPGMTGAQVEAAESNSVYVEVKAMYSYAYEVLNRVNTIRREAGLPTLVLDVELTEKSPFVDVSCMWLKGQEYRPVTYNLYYHFLSAFIHPSIYWEETDRVSGSE